MFSVILAPFSLRIVLIQRFSFNICRPFPPQAARHCRYTRYFLSQRIYLICVSATAGADKVLLSSAGGSRGDAQAGLLQRSPGERAGPVHGLAARQASQRHGGGIL